MQKRLSLVLLGIWLILFGFFGLVHVDYSMLILAIWGIITGILILIDK
jgi:hypothetical protein